MPSTSHAQRKPGSFIDELSQMQKVLSDITDKYKRLSDETYVRAEYAEWHLLGLMYHAKRMTEEYTAVAEELMKRLNPDQHIDVLIMHTPQMQNLIYEFYAFISLARITLDNLRYILYPLFMNPPKELPKSITDLGSGKTDCPVYERIANTPELQYMIDLRNCLVHHRTLAINKNAVIAHEKVGDLPPELKTPWTQTMGKGVYRITESMDVVFNLFLPDTVFDKTENKKLVEFTYHTRLNLLGESMRFLRHIFFNYLDAFTQNVISPEKRYKFDRKGQITPVEFKYVVF